MPSITHTSSSPSLLSHILSFCFFIPDTKSIQDNLARLVLSMIAKSMISHSLIFALKMRVDKQSDC